MKAKYRNRYMRKAMQKGFLESFRETDQQMRETFLFNLLRISLIAILKKWSMTKYANSENTTEKTSRTIN
jgi:hypothetical protein